MLSTDQNTTLSMEVTHQLSLVSSDVFFVTAEPPMKGHGKNKDLHIRDEIVWC